MALTQVQGGMLAGSTNTTTTIQSNGTTAITIDTSQKVGIGAASPAAWGSPNLYIKQTSATPYTGLALESSSNGNGIYVGHTGSVGILGVTYGASGSFTPLTFETSGTERMRITSGGDVVIGKTTTSFSTAGTVIQSDGSTLITKTHPDSGGSQLYLNRLNVNGPAVYFFKDTTTVGNISVTGSATSYNSGSDYRLKNDIQPLTNALEKVALLKPSKWTWKADNTYGDGFVAHELAEVCPNAVTGEKDAVETYTDEDGNEQTRINPQGVDTSFLVATLTAAIQELNAKVEAQAAEIAALKVAK